MAAPTALSASAPLSQTRFRSIIVLAVLALTTILLDIWRMVGWMNGDLPADPHISNGARLLLILATLACLVGLFILAGFILTRERAFGKILGILTMISSATLAAAFRVVEESNQTSMYFDRISADSNSFLVKLLGYTVIGGLAILGIAVYSGGTRLADGVTIPGAAGISLYGKRDNEASTETPPPHPVHYRLNWAQVLVVAILWVASMPILVVGPFIEEPVISPDGTYVLIGLSQVLFFAAAILLFVLVLTRRRAIGVIVGSLIASSGLAVIAAFIIALSRPIGRDYFNWPGDLDIEAFFLLPTPLLGLAIIALCLRGFAYGSSKAH